MLFIITMVSEIDLRWRGVMMLTMSTVKPSIGYEADQFFFGWNYLEWRDGWPVVV